VDAILRTGPGEKEREYYQNGAAAQGRAFSNET